MHDFFKQWVVQETTMQQTTTTARFHHNKKETQITHKSKQQDTSTLPCESRNSLIPGRIYQSPFEAPSFFLPSFLATALFLLSSDNYPLHLQ
jgi:hypothetical protein